MILIILILFFLYLTIYFKFYYSPDYANDFPELKVSVIIAAKNESHNLQKLFNALKSQEYSEDNFEIVLVDDQSTDNTFEIAKLLFSDSTNFRVISAEDKLFEGKRGVLDIGIKNSKYSNIFLTDADCEPEELWIKSYSNKLQQGYDFLFGVSPYKQNNLWINKIASFDNLWVHILTFSFADIGLPYSAAGRSFGFRKESFLNIDGYSKTTETLSGDDDLLLREAKNNKLRIGTFSQPGSIVYTEAKSTFTEFLNQKSRHTSTSNFYSLGVKVILGLWHLLNLIMLFSPFLYFIDRRFLVVFIIKLAGDVVVVQLLMKYFSYKFNVLEIIILQIVYEIMIVINYARGLFFKKKW